MTLDFHPCRRKIVNRGPYAYSCTAIYRTLKCPDLRMPDEQSQVCESITRGQRILMKGCITGEADFLRGQCNVTSSSPEHSSRLSCRYSVLNDPFSCIYQSRDRQCFSMGRTTIKIAPTST